MREDRVIEAFLSVLVLAVFAPPARPESPGARVELVSVGTDGVAGNHHSGSDGATPPRDRISADGRYVVFESYAGTLVCRDDDFSTRDVFVRDRLTGRSTVVSVAANGGEANDNSFDPAISADGRYVAFSSAATNLVAGDTNGYIDVFLRDLQAGTTVRLSVSSAGDQSDGPAYGADLSADGRYVAFYSNGSGLVPGDTNGRWDSFVRDVVAGTTERVSVSTAGAESSCCDGLHPTISADGRYVAFLSQGRLDPSINNNSQEIYIRDRVAGTTTLVRPTAEGGLSNTGIRFADLSADGRFVAFQSNSDNVVVPDQNGFIHDVFVKDLVTGMTRLVSQASDGTPGNRDSWMPSISADGRYVAFHSWANNLVAGDTNTQPYYDVFVRDLQLGTTTRVDVRPDGGEADGSSASPSISGDGRLVVFESTATNLAPNDRSNGYPDVYVAGPSYPAAGDNSFQFASAAFDAAESIGLARVTVTRYGPFCAPASVQYATADGSATAGADYAAASGTLNFPSGEGSKSFDIPVLDDGADESDETVQLTLSNPTGGPELGSPVTATLTIVDDEAPANSPPYVVDDAVTTPEDAAVAVDVLANDVDADGDALAVTSFTQGSHGSVGAGGSGALMYTPTANFHGSDTFQYTVADGRGGSGSASVQVTITPVNDTPAASADQYTTRNGEVLGVGAASGVLANDVDPDGDALNAALVDGPAQGALTLAADGSFTYVPPDANTGPVTFTYRAVDAQGASSAPATVTVVVAAEGAVATCRPVTPAVLHKVKPNGADFMGEPFLGNRRLTPIADDGTVPCVEVDTMEVTRCVFSTGTEDVPSSRLIRRSSGPWMEDAEGRRWAVVGQPVTRDGALDRGAFIVGTEPDADGSAPCLASSGNDAPGILAVTKQDLASTGYLEQGGSETNFGWGRLQNVATLLVGTSSFPHPDGAQLVYHDPIAGIYWYTGLGAAVNDVNGERDQLGTYYYLEWSQHYVMVGGIMVPAAKRPSTRSYPPPARIDFNSRIRWLPVNPYVNIANGSPLDPRVGARPTARFTHAVNGSALSVDAGGSQGDIFLYAWDLDWTTRNPDAYSSSPTAQFPFAPEAVPPLGVVTLVVTSRDGQQDISRENVVLRPAPVADFTWGVGINTLWVDATGSAGDIVQYAWDLGWTEKYPDTVSASPTAEFPIAFPDVPLTSGVVTLTVTARDGQQGSRQRTVKFRVRNPFPVGSSAGSGNN
jgi:Tol biopolymer transport system component